MKDFDLNVYNLLKLIPKGMVTTYKDIANALNMPKHCRQVGRALHNNPDPQNFPCYKVVNFKGEVSANFGFGGTKEQIKRLKADGINVYNNRVENLNEIRFRYEN